MLPLLSPTWTFFRGLQIKSQHNFFELLRKPPTSRHLISEFVSLFITETPSAHIKEAWPKDMEVEISDDIWIKALGGINARLQLIQFKVIHRLHYFKTRLNKICPSVSPKCDKSKSSDGTLGHLFLFCSKLKKYSIYCCNLYSSIYERPIMMDSPSFWVVLIRL